MTDLTTAEAELADALASEPDSILRGTIVSYRHTADATRLPCVKAIWLSVIIGFEHELARRRAQREKQEPTDA